MTAPAPTEPVTSPSTIRAVLVDDRGLGDAVQVMFLALVVVAAVMLLTLAGRSAEARTRVDHAAESAAQAAAQQRTPGAAVHAATITATASLDGPCAGGPTVNVDTGGWTPGGIVAVTISCQIATSDLGPLPLPGNLTMTASSAAVVDAYRYIPDGFSNSEAVDGSNSTGGGG